MKEGSQKRLVIIVILRIESVGIIVTGFWYIHGIDVGYVTNNNVLVADEESFYLSLSFFTSIYEW